jgi:hypothetical protein
LNSREAATAQNSVEAKSCLKFPEELLMMLGSLQEEAEISRVTCIHVFETMPQSKCAVAYEIFSPRHDDEMVYIVIVYSTTANLALRILWSSSEVTQICTPSDD